MVLDELPPQATRAARETMLSSVRRILRIGIPARWREISAKA